MFCGEDITTFFFIIINYKWCLLRHATFGMTPYTKYFHFTYFCIVNNYSKWAKKILPEYLRVFRVDLFDFQE